MLTHEQVESIAIAAAGQAMAAVIGPKAEVTVFAEAVETTPGTEVARENPAPVEPVSDPAKEGESAPDQPVEPVKEGEDSPPSGTEPESDGETATEGPGDTAPAGVTLDFTGAYEFARLNDFPPAEAVWLQITPRKLRGDGWKAVSAAEHVGVMTFTAVAQALQRLVTPPESITGRHVPSRPPEVKTFGKPGRLLRGLKPLAAVKGEKKTPRACKKSKNQ
jgi:hypothetical protein